MRSRRLRCAVVAAAAVVAAGGLSACSRGSRGHVAPSTAVPEAPATTLDGSALTVAAPPTVAGASSTRAQATTVAPPPSTAPVVTGAGAVLAPPAGPVRHAMPVSACAELAEPGWDVASCGTAAGTVLGLTWLVETHPVAAGTAHRIWIWRPATAGQLEAALVAADDQATAWTDVRVAVAAMSAAGGQQILVGIHERANRVVDVDLVDSPGRVAVHLRAADLAAVGSTGQLDAWEPSPTPGDATVVHQVLRNTDGSWRVVQVSRVGAPAPASQV